MPRRVVTYKPSHLSINLAASSTFVSSSPVHVFHMASHFIAGGSPGHHLSHSDTGSIHVASEQPLQTCSVFLALSCTAALLQITFAPIVISYGNPSQKMADLSCGRSKGGGVNRTATLDFWGANFGLFWRLVDRVPWDTVLRSQAVQKGWTLFRREVSKVQGQAVPMCRERWQGRSWPG